ncbi:beta-ketoacyl synthase N-terminal-like domain-containing protein [Echinicola rosea]|uniref:3-oxoacyl-ACP synthase n=1 Tax=Echinicola rosea TaxID=1807691 RepID=A0ABQ1UIE3_9BACT|nr:beta-ketoacyl synthase N-terminal-like domain-containing protein [Echinicola rosea]GGF19654.1 hypothetical protein GCM10011339_04570 [Echinicola rosea]
MGYSHISITKAMGINPLGFHASEENDRYASSHHALDQNERGDWKGSIPDEIWRDINSYISNLGHKPERFPEEAKLLSYLIHHMRLQPKDKQLINAATSRGSIDFLSQMQTDHHSLPVWTSPHSTLGFPSSWPALLHEADAPLFFQSSTCSSFGLTLQNAFAWLNSGMADTFIAAAVECPTAPLTIDQMKAIRIYAQDKAMTYPCQSMDFQKANNSMVLGEGAYAFRLEKNNSRGVAYLKGVGSAMEKINHSTELSQTGDCIVSAANTVFGEFPMDKIDLIIGHFPGTKLGDLAEKTAYERIFGQVPFTLSNKWKIGHSLGASLAANMDLAIAILQSQTIPKLPSYIQQESTPPSVMNNILITALGFGGQAICAVVGR